MSIVDRAFPSRHWSTKIPCRGCGRKVLAGAVAANTHEDPPRACLCFRCLNDLLDHPDTFEADHPLTG